jgi:hypothetical protein
LKYELQPESSLPFSGKEKTCTIRENESRTAFVYNSLHHSRAGNSTRVKVMLRTMGPVAAEISGGSKIFKFYSGGIIDDMALMEQGVDAKSDLVCSAGKVNHAVLIVGWGIEDNGDEYFMIKNSFGTDWGENGYAKISTKASRRLPLGSCNILSSVLAPWFQEME